MRGHSASGRAQICCWSMSHTCFIKYKSGEGSGQSIHSIFSPSMYSLTTHPSPVRTGVSVEKHKGLVHRTRIWVHSCLNYLIYIVEAGQVSSNDDKQVSWTLIEHPALTSNDAPRNLICFWAQQSLHRPFYHHTLLLFKDKLGLISKHYSLMFTNLVD